MGGLARWAGGLAAGWSDRWDGMNERIDRCIYGWMGD